ncbi:MAG: leucine-rich repeat domain-containing protein [bacterium]
MQTLIVWGTEITTLAPIAGLSALEVLVFSGTPVTDLGPLAALTALQRLVCASGRSPISRRWRGSRRCGG